MNPGITTKKAMHRRNTPSAKLPSLTDLIRGSLHLFAQFPTPARVLLSRGAEWGLIKAINPLLSTAFEATFNKLQLIRTTLIYKRIINLYN